MIEWILLALVLVGYYRCRRAFLVWCSIVSIQSRTHGRPFVLAVDDRLRRLALRTREAFEWEEMLARATRQQTTTWVREQLHFHARFVSQMRKKAFWDVFEWARKRGVSLRYNVEVTIDRNRSLEDQPPSGEWLTRPEAIPAERFVSAKPSIELYRWVLPETIWPPIDSTPMRSWSRFLLPALILFALSVSFALVGQQSTERVEEYLEHTQSSVISAPVQPETAPAVVVQTLFVNGARIDDAAIIEELKDALEMGGAIDNLRLSGFNDEDVVVETLIDDGPNEFGGLRAWTRIVTETRFIHFIGGDVVNARGVDTGPARLIALRSSWEHAAEKLKQESHVDTLVIPQIVGMTVDGDPIVDATQQRILTLAFGGIPGELTIATTIRRFHKEGSALNGVEAWTTVTTPDRRVELDQGSPGLWCSQSSRAQIMAEVHNAITWAWRAAAYRFNE